ncbi:hypothetical protein Q428_04975 [Fervidicella metallireducens AeB]|uniref:Uncharacterized protein n=1 Tax=Fervidicella metallireducens AeB TaxID=1403537 RepID=A0A017RYM7_9CLOT|nr:hypothetical protein Q428_04975 [Fervidicella metallireducens AeB]
MECKELITFEYEIRHCYNQYIVFKWDAGGIL